MAQEWEKLSQELMEETDVVYEQELQRNPHSIKVWWAYIQTKKADAKRQVRWLLYERAVQALPRCYKFWHAYLTERRAAIRGDCITDVDFEKVNAIHERALVFLSKMPRIWLDYCEFLMHQHKVTRTRRALDRSLRSLPIAQHGRIWELYVQFLKMEGVPQETALCAFRRYLMLEPDHVEIYISYLLTIGHYDEAASHLARIVNDDDFYSMEGKSNHQLWMDLCDIISKHPTEIKSLKIEPILRGGIAKFTDEVGRLWNSLADHFIRLGQFEKSRDVYEEALMSVSTVRDFSLVFDAYSKYNETLVSAHMARMEEEGEEATEEDEIDLLMARLEYCIQRRPEILSSVLLRQNPHNVHEWIKRTKLYSDNPEKVIQTYTEAVMTIDPMKAVGRLNALWIKFANFYEAHGDVKNARVIFEKAAAVNFKAVDDLASVWCEWVEMELRHHNHKAALEVVRRAVSTRSDDISTSQARLYRSVKLWSLCMDLEECFGTVDTMRTTFDRICELKVATPQLIVNYAHYLEEYRYFEESFTVYERGVSVFKWPHVHDIWYMYLSKFVGRYGGRKLERARDLFEQALDGMPPKHAKQFYCLYANLEEQFGLARHALAIYERSTKSCDEGDRFELYSLYIAKTAEFFGMVRTREIYEIAIQNLKELEIKDMCLRYAEVERALGEIDRARGIYRHASQFADPLKHKDIWTIWRDFEVLHGNEETFREMLRIKRSVEAQYSTSHFGSSTGDADLTNPMEIAEQLAADKKKGKRPADELPTSPNQGSPKKPKVDEGDLAFEASDKFTGKREGMVFKLGSQGLGYYQDVPPGTKAKKKVVAIDNDEEIDLDLDFEAEVPSAVFGGLAAADPEAEKAAKPMGALERFRKAAQ